MRTTWAVGLLALLLPWKATLAGPPKPPKVAPPPKGASPAAPLADEAVAPAVRAAAAERALAWLERNALGLANTQGTPQKPFTLAFTGLDLLLDAGAYAPSGTRARLLASIRRALSGYLSEVERRVADPASLPRAYGVADSSRLVQYVWPVALTGWLLSECVARDLDAGAARADLRRVAALLEGAQYADDGWGHGLIADPPPYDPGASRGGTLLTGYPPTLLAPTNCAAPAIAFLDRALARGTSQAARRARAHYQRAVLANGNLPYDLRQRTADGDLTGVGRAAGALLGLHALGVSHDDPAFVRVAGFLRQHWDLVGEGHGSPVLNLVFGALAAYLLGPDDVVAFERAWLPAVLAKQAQDGALDCACQHRLFGSSCDSPAGKGMGLAVFAQGQSGYVTALTTFVLLLRRDTPRVLAPGSAAPSPAVTPR